jgi:predicted GNAT family acetyltransferase
LERKMDKLHDNASAGQYELDIDGQTVVARYRREDGVLTILWVEAPPALRGTGAAGRLMKLVAQEAREQTWRVVPVCGYAAAWLRRSPEYRELVI